MYKFIRAVVISSILLCNALIATAQTYTSGVVRVKFKENAISNIQSARLKRQQFGIASVDKASATLGVTSITRVFQESERFEKAHRKFGLHLWYEIKFSERTSVSTALNIYRNLAELEIVEPCLPYQLVEPVRDNLNTVLPSAFSGTTNDPLFDQQWHFQNTGQNNGTPGADISLTEAWTIQTGNPEVIVAVIDGGIDILHPDLLASIWINADEIPGNLIDDDNNGYVDDVNGYGFGDGTGTLYPHFHGTHVAGTIAAVTNNAVGVAGIAGGSGTGNGVRLMSCAGFGLYNVGGFEAAMVYAADNGAVISQNSWRGGSNAIEAAIDYFVARAGYDNSEDNFDDNIQIGPMAGGIVIFAAGNSSTNDPTDGYPASYSPVMAVAATDNKDLRSYFSNYGSWVDIAAPGSDVYSTYPVDQGSYATLSGTSMACPHVSGVAALIISQFKAPAYSPFLVWDRIQFTADNIDALNPGYEHMLGGGRINAFQALQVADDVPPDAITTLNAQTVNLTSIVLQWTATGSSGNTGVASSYDLRYSTTPITAANFNSATPVVGAPKPKIAGTVQEFEVLGLSHSTTYYFAIKARDFFGNVADLSNVLMKATLQPPIIQVSPSSIQSALLSGQSESRTVTIRNTGASTLSWNLKFAADPSPGNIPEAGSLKVETAEKIKTNFNNTGERVSALLADGYSPEDVGDFEEKMSSPVPLTCVSVDPSTGLIYAQANMGNTFYQYSPATNLWSQLADCPVYSGNNGGAVFLNGKIYTVYVENSSQIGVYTIATNSWTTISNNLYYGTGNITTDGTYLYLVKDITFMRYEPITNVWTSMASPPFYFQSWGGLSFYNNEIFGQQGNGYSAFSKYDVSTNIWTILPNVPGGAVLGSAIDPSAGVYYAYGWYRSNYWYAYNIAQGTWSYSTIPFYVSITDGGLVYVPQNGVSGIYFTQGEEATGFARFETGPSTNWLSADPVTGLVPAGTSQTVNVLLNAENLYGGTYHATIDIHHNDPARAVVEIPVTLVVTGAPNLRANKTSIAYGDVYIGAQHDSVLTITNTGTDLLSVSAITVGNANYQIGFEAFSLSPREHKDFTITFRPSAPGTYNTTLTIMSNDPDNASISIPLTGKGLFNPLSVTPSSLEISLITGQQDTRQITISNSGSTPLTWNGTTQGLGSNNLDDILINLMANYSQVTNIIPSRYDFSEGEYGYYISDGGYDMYDGGNYMTTDMGGDYNYINYTNGSMMTDSKFGSGGKYFTAKFPGLFVMAADVMLNSFSITGNLGADGSGAVDASVLSTSRGGRMYKGFVKRVYNAWDPSVNHLIIMEDNGVASQDYTTYTDSDFHKINNLSGVKRIYYLLFSGTSGAYISDASMQTIMDAFLNSVNEGIPWITLGKKTGTIPAGGSENVTVTFSALNMDGGVYNASILISDNVPIKEPISIPVTLTVIGKPDIDLSKTSVNFQNVYIGGLAERFVSLKNLGSDILVVSNIVSSNAQFVITPSSVTLAPHDSTRINITFSPSQAGSQSGTIEIASNDPDEALRIISLSGNGTTPPVADIAPGAVDMKIFRGDRQNVLIKIRNTGGDVMNWNLFNPWSMPYWSSLSAQYGQLYSGEEQNLRLVVDANNLSVIDYAFDIYFNYNSPINPQVVIPVMVRVVENHPPIAVHSISDQLIKLHDPAMSINLAEYFLDEDGEPMLYYVDVNSTILTATILGSELLLTPNELGEVEVNVWTVDGLGERADLYFMVTVEAVTGTEPDLAASSLQNHPNPFNEKTTITYQLKKNGFVQLVLQDVTGRIVETLVNENQTPGEKRLEFRAGGIQSGLYFYHLMVDGKSNGVRKMIKY